MSGCLGVDKMPGKGYIHVHRKIWENAFFSSSERFDRRSAWLWLITHANYEKGSFLAKGRICYVQRGQLFTSVRYLAKIWGWDKDTVRRFLTDAETEKMITVTRTQSGTLITIVNFNKYNASGNSASEDTDTDADTEPTSNTDSTPYAEPSLLKKNIKKNIEKSKKETRGGRVIE